ncbi:hypothetical protein D0Z07_5252 [Hyphodiscus hymeniophilus]|uniref:Uncharacterized protein n=1 Tax=Hyphodiscus hymeniophilus TaxID=353542 RepID=A0A9P6VIU2_9HELO|nr:hypothetical protein D0Z07_5252 [Hyphodiscus hymeniophilus]
MDASTSDESPPPYSNSRYLPVNPGFCNQAWEERQANQRPKEGMPSDQYYKPCKGCGLVCGDYIPASYKAGWPKWVDPSVNFRWESHIAASSTELKELLGCWICWEYEEAWIMPMVQDDWCDAEEEELRESEVSEDPFIVQTTEYDSYYRLTIIEVHNQMSVVSRISASSMHVESTPEIREENGQSWITLSQADEHGPTNVEDLGPHMTFYGSEPQLQLTTTASPTSEELDCVYRRRRLRNDTYLEIFVLLLSWQGEDPRLPVDREIDCLYDVFKRLYGFKVERWRIPSIDSHIQLNKKILDLVELGGDGEDSLKIVYYAGHGKLTRNRHSMWTDHRGRSVIWAGIQNALEQAKSDALILIDSCNSGTANTDRGFGVTELIAAGGFNNIVNGVGPWSFTHGLVAELRLLSNGHPFTVARLHNRIVSRMQNQLLDGEEYHNPFEILPKERFVTPVHLVLTEDSESISWRIQIRRKSSSSTPFTAFQQNGPVFHTAPVQTPSDSPRFEPPPICSLSSHTSIQITPIFSLPASTSSPSAAKPGSPLMGPKNSDITKVDFVRSAETLLVAVEDDLKRLEKQLFWSTENDSIGEALDARLNVTYDNINQIQQQLQMQSSRTPYRFHKVSQEICCGPAEPGACS